MKVVDKYIDLNQFPMDERGRILWKDSVGIIAEFYYYGEKHILKILEYGIPKRNYIKYQVDDMLPEIAKTQKIKDLYFDELFYKPNYLYKIGDVVNGSVIIEQLYLADNPNNYYKKKFYKCKCLVDGYEFVVEEKELKDGRKCPKCVGRILIVGYNDLATTDPDVVGFLLDKEDAHRYTRGSNKRVWAICPHCGHKKRIKILSLVNRGFSCPICSDGLSYPNKFAFNVFMQISNQYQEYIPEYTPDWIKPKRYDNYIKLKDDKKIIVEMDGGFHDKNHGKYTSKYDEYKDALAKEHGIEVIRIDCFYNQITERFNFIKTNFIKSLSQYFDLSNVDWDFANEAGISSKLIEAVNYYNEYPFMTNQQIADKFHVGVVTIRHYLIVGEKLGLCKYIRHDGNRCKTSIPLALYDSRSNLIGVYLSSRHMVEVLKDKEFCASSIRKYSRTGKPYKGYIIKRITWEEYDQYQNNVTNSSIL